MKWKYLKNLINKFGNFNKLGFLAAIFQVNSFIPHVHFIILYTVSRIEKEGNTVAEKKSKLKENQSQYDYIEERFEVIEGIRYDMHAAPTVRHQQLVTYLWKNIEERCAPEGLILTAPIDVKFDEENECQPDIIYICNDNLGIVTEKKIIGAPDIIIEILSPSTSYNDKIRKKAIYERFGVKEYWIVDPIHLYIDQFVLSDNSFILAHTYGKKDTIRSQLFSCIRIDLEPIFNRLLVFD